MAACDNFMSLKFKNRAGVIYDNDWIAGVEYKTPKMKTRITVKKIRKKKTIQKAKMMKMRIKKKI